MILVTHQRPGLYLTDPNECLHVRAIVECIRLFPERFPFFERRLQRRQCISWPSSDNRFCRSSSLEWSKCFTTRVAKKFLLRWTFPPRRGLGTEPCIVAESVTATKRLISSDRSLSTSLLSFSRDYSQILCHIHSKQELGLN